MSSKNKIRLLVADDEAHIRRTLIDILEFEKAEVIEARDGLEAYIKCKQFQFDAVFLDIKMPGMDGIKALEKILEIQPDLPIIMISGHGDIQTAVECTKIGAYAFLPKPIDLNSMLITLRNALERKNLVGTTRVLTSPVHIQEIIGSTPAIENVRELIEKVAIDDSSVLVTGANGSGKELVAQWIHAKSLREKGPIIEVNCAAIPETLIDSELFGHKKGSFTDATEDRPGKFEVASSGTLFLDEIGDLSLPAQAKILRALETRRIRRVGDTKDINIDVRVVAATNKDLIQEIEAGRFRIDLLNRINVIQIHVPSLAERREDIPELINHFMERLREKKAQPDREIEQEAIEMLKMYSWPGNIRELWNTMNRLFILGDAVISGENVQKYLLDQPQNRLDPMQDLFSRFDSFEAMSTFLSAEWTKRRG
jgi:two-component system, NtrC family, nitrogen regulation response regulator NtrX